MDCAGCAIYFSSRTRDFRVRWPNWPVMVVPEYAEMEGLAPGFPRLIKPFRSAELAASLAALMPVAEEQ
jgi:hypothetical protein